MDLTGSIGLEKIQRAAIKVLFEGLNDMIDELTPEWTAADDDFNLALGRGTVDFRLEHVQDENFYAGTIPSLIEADVTKYPNVAAIAYVGTPKRSFDDTGENYTVTLAIETMVKSENNEVECNARIQKMIDAIHKTIKANKTIDNTVSDVLPPAVTIGDPFPRRHEKGRGDKWYWQGGALTYTLDKFVLWES